MIRQYLSHSYPQAAPSSTEGSRAGYSTDRISSDDSKDFRRLDDLYTLYILSRRDPSCWRITKSLPALTVGRGFKIIPQSEPARKAIKEFLFKIHKADPVTAMLVGARELAEDTVWSGRGWWERIYSKEWDQNDDPFKIKGNQIVGLKKIHPLTLDFKRETTGEIILDKAGSFGRKNEFLAYTQSYTLTGSWKSRDVDKRRVAYLKFNSIGDELLGISDLEPIYQTIRRSASITDGIAQGAFRHGVPFLDVTVGDEQHQPDKEMMDNAREEVKNSSYMSEFVHPPWYKTDLKEQFSLAKSENILKPFTLLISTATGLPLSVLTGSGEGTNKATMTELVNLIQPLVIAPRQQALKLFLEEQVFAPLMEMNKIEGVPLIQWNELFPPDFSIADKIKIMSEILIENKPLLNWVEAREILRLPSQEEGTFYALSREELSANSRAINLPEPHGLLIYNGTKTAVVSDKPHPEMVDIPLECISGGEAYGKIKLSSPVEISDFREFQKYQQLHRMTDDERTDLKWAFPMYMFKIKIIILYKSTKKVSVPSSAPMFLSNVSYKNNIINLSMGARIDEG